MDIRKHREAAGLTPAELADKVGTHRRNIDRWESGDTQPRKIVLARLHEALGVKRNLAREGLSPLGAFVENAALQKGWSHAALAREAGLHRATVSRTVNGRYKPSFETAQKLANALGVSPNKIFKLRNAT